MTFETFFWASVFALIVMPVSVFMCATIVSLLSAGPEPKPEKPNVMANLFMLNDPTGRY